MYNQKFRVGIIGGSANNGWAREAHIPAVRLLPELELTSICTSSKESAEKSARAFKAANAFTSARELSQHPEVDMIVISIKVTDHYDAVKEVVSAGKPIYCEWPLGSNTAQASEMQQWAEFFKVPNAIGLQALQSPVVHYLRDLVSEGFVGKVLSVNMKVYSEKFGGTAFKGSEYLLDKKSGGNLLTIRGGHSLAALSFILGDFIELSSVMTTHYHEAKLCNTNESVAKDAEDQILIIGTLEGGAAANVHIQGGIKHQEGTILEIFGDQGTIILTSPSTIQLGPYKVMGARQSEKLEELKIPDQYFWVPEEIKNAGSKILNVAQAYRRFAKDVQKGISRMPTFSDAVKLHRLLDAIVRAAHTGERQYFS